MADMKRHLYTPHTQTHTHTEIEKRNTFECEIAGQKFQSDTAGMSRSVGVSFLEKRKPNVQKCTPPPLPTEKFPFFSSNISLHHHPFARGKHRYVFAEVTRKQVANEAFNFGKVTSM